MSKKILVFLCLATLLAGCKVQFGEQEQEPAQGREATAQERPILETKAAQFLATLDARQWDKAWRDASPAMRKTTTQEGFSKAVIASRAMFGEPRQRRVTSRMVTEKIEGAPPGHYGIVFFSTNFSRVENVQEHVVLSQENGDWKLAGYWAQKSVVAGSP